MEIKEAALKWWSGLSYLEQEELLKRFIKSRVVEDIIFMFESINI